VVWIKKVGKNSGEPAVGLDGTIYVSLQSEELVAIISDGSQLWKKGLVGHRDAYLRGITTPAIRADGSLIVAAMRKVACLEPDGTSRWEKTIDGLPMTPNIGPQGIIYVSAWSIDWAGVYVISPEGESFGQDDPIISNRWHAKIGTTTFPAAIDEDGNVFVAYRNNATHPSTYGWGDEYPEEFFYNCVIFDSEGNKISDFLPKGPARPLYPSPTTGTCVFNSVSISTDNLVHYMGGGPSEIFAFALSDILVIERPKNFDWGPYYCEYSADRNKIIEEMNQACRWLWHDMRDIDSNGKKGPIYDQNTISYPALADDSVVWVRLAQKTFSHDQPSDTILRIDGSKIKEQKIYFGYFKVPANYDHFKLPANIGASQIIDSNGIVYAGCDNGNVYTLDPDGTILQTIDVDQPVSSLVIGLDESLIVVTKNGNVCLVR
jgi:outer membrane protein assembly factor BamB